jgi:hypothetical protein
MIPAYLLLLVMLAACQSASLGTQGPEDIKTQTSIPDLSPEGTPPLPTTEESIMDSPITPDAAAQKMVDLAKAHLAQRLSISAGQITLIEVRPVVWRDASLGCPKPAVDYMRVETPGFRIVLEAGGKTYNRHTDESRRVVLCATP